MSGRIILRVTRWGWDIGPALASTFYAPRVFAMDGEFLGERGLAAFEGASNAFEHQAEDGADNKRKQHFGAG
jgi:hypothetical protein